MNCCICSAPMDVFIDFHKDTGDMAELWSCSYRECGAVVVLL